MKPRERVLRIVRYILAQPYKLTRKDLQDKFDVGKDAIDDDIKAIKDAGINFQQDKPLYRCAIFPDPAFDELRYLQPLTEIERGKISRILHDSMGSSKEATYLTKKLASLYDFQQLGLNALRRPALERLSLLEAAQKDKKQIILVNYRSNSNKIKDRLVEAFDIQADLDTVQAFDPNESSKEKRIKHFKLSRIERIQITDTPWQHETKHHRRATDVFRIAMDNQILVSLNMDVYAYNSLIDNYPKAKGDCMSGTLPNTFNFQSRVNPQFLGLVNFIMNNAGHVEIISPEGLKDRVRERARALIKSLDDT